MSAGRTKDTYGSDLFNLSNAGRVRIYIHDGVLTIIQEVVQWTLWDGFKSTRKATSTRESLVTVTHPLLEEKRRQPSDNVGNWRATSTTTWRSLGTVYRSDTRWRGQVAHQNEKPLYHFCSKKFIILGNRLPVCKVSLFSLSVLKAES